MIPGLRFPEFKDEWKNELLEDLSVRGSGHTPAKGISEYYEGNIPWVSLADSKWLDNGYIEKTKITISDVGIANSSAVLHPPETVLLSRDAGVGKSAVMKTYMAVSQHFIVWRTIKGKLDNWFLYYILQIQKREFERIAIGSTIKTIGLPYFKKFRISIPTHPEQQKIAAFLSTVDQKIQILQRKKERLEQYKKGVMQKLFSQEIRFKYEDGNDYPDWGERKFHEVLFEHGSKSTGNEQVFSVSVHKGLINQIEHLGRSFAAASTDHYNLVRPNDMVYTKSPTGSFPYGIIKQSKVDKDVIVSPLYGVFTPETPGLGYMLNIYFESVANTHNYLHSIIQKGPKNTINITNTTFLSKALNLPVSLTEQKKIGMFLKVLDIKIEFCVENIMRSQQFKKGLLQQMFV